MATAKLELYLLFVSISSLFFPALSSITTSATDVWCDETPNPGPCKYYMNQFPKNYLPKQKSDFKKWSLQIALDRAFHAAVHTNGLGPKCRNEKEKAAWADCMVLYENTILQLNQTLDPSTKCTDFDVQTWLSAALTNLETCRDGFVELGVTDFILPLMSNNVSKLISNALAINNASTEPTTYYSDGFPSWVKGGDRELLQTSSMKPNLVVAQDGSGNYKTVKDAIEAAAKRTESGRFVIYVKKGVYNENVEIGNKMKNIMLIGDGMRHTIITGSKSAGGGSSTFNSATFIVTGSGFIARGITFRNTAGPQNYQAVALRSSADLSVFYQCGFEGYQDTLYVHSNRQYYKDCYIYGTIDFIFGNAAVVLQNCMIYARRPMPGQFIAITAQGRNNPNDASGISIHNSRIMAGADLAPVLGSFRAYLGRPWKEYSRTVYLQCYFENLIHPAGWAEWDRDFALNTLYYGEYKNYGPGSSTNGRVKWGGYRIITSGTEASKFTVNSFIAGQSWLPATGVPFKGGL